MRLIVCENAYSGVVLVILFKIKGRDLLPPFVFLQLTTVSLLSV